MKKLSALTISTATFLTLAPSAFAAGINVGSISICNSVAQNQGGLRFGNLCGIGATGVGPLISSIITILFIVAVLLALGFLVYGGIKWITSGGDKGKVEAARGTIVAALVGLVLVFLSYFIINLVAGFFGIGSLSSGSTFTLPTLQSN